MIYIHRYGVERQSFRRRKDDCAVNVVDLPETENVTAVRHSHMARKAVIAACVRSGVLPERSGKVGHIKEETARFVKDLWGQTLAREALQTKIIANKGI